MYPQQHNDAVPADFDEISIGVASPEQILKWSHGEVTKPETINYRTQRPEKSGLFDEKIFGPEKDYECYCGKYKGIRFKGIICEKCGVELTRAIVRRERMGHIDLAVPVAHIWFLRGMPSRIATVLGLSATDVENVIYFAGYIVTKVDEAERETLLRDLETEFQAKFKSSKEDKEKERLKSVATQAKADIEAIRAGVVLDEAKYHNFAIRYGAMFEAAIGAEAIFQILKNLDLPALREQLVTALETAAATERERIRKRMALVENFIRSGGRPEWMFMTRLPVVPPALRPMVALEGGRHASSDINDLYRRVINRNNRLKKLMAIYAPEVILRNEKRILQEAIDALLDNSMRRQTALSGISAAQRRPLKSLADYLSGKHGYFRGNLLGKRVDYSGRSVIVIGPSLELDECGLPKHMALELFKPFVTRELLARELAFNIRGAGRLIEDGVPEVWAILEEVIKGKHVLLNRAPTLHRQSVQAFRPRLIEGSAIQLHPLVCPAFNADFDGDTMSVHVPLSDEAQMEAATIMSANKNILKPGSGEVTTQARHDIILGCYWMTKIEDGAIGEGKAFPSSNAAITAFDYGVVGFRSKIKVLPGDDAKYAEFEGKVFETSVGRLLFNSILPKDFPYINEEITSKRVSTLVADLVRHYSLDGLPKILDKIKAFGFKYSTVAGTTFSFSDIRIPKDKKAIVEESKETVAKIWEQYNEGLLTADERYRQVIRVWEETKSRVQDKVIEALDPKSPVSDMIVSKARGSVGQLVQMVGMKGLISNPRGDVLEFPILSNMKEGLSPLEYFISTHGSRKGLADTALNTARAGYLTRRLFDVAQDVIVLEDDCGTKNSVLLPRPGDREVGGSFGEKLTGRIVAKEVVDIEGVILFKKGTLLTYDDARVVERSSAKEAWVRSPMTCATHRGVCQQCYGYDLSNGELVDLGEAVGVVAAQAIGEPGTQLTMRTFHTGGVASQGGDITMGLPRVEELFEIRTPKIPALVSHIDGFISSIAKEGEETVLRITPTQGKGAKRDTEYFVHPARQLFVKEGQEVSQGQIMTDGSCDLEELFQYAGRETTQEYIIKEITRIYELQGVTISRKHLEIIVKQMFSRVQVKDVGDTRFTSNEIVQEDALMTANDAARISGKEPAKALSLVLGIAEVALSRQSFLSTISFQHTTRKLTDAAIAGSRDRLVGLKENVIVGRLIPAGTGFEGSKKRAMIANLQAHLDEVEADAARMVADAKSVSDSHAQE
jgi:DNA-directed RNA polymerase subunit beta'